MTPTEKLVLDEDQQTIANFFVLLGYGMDSDRESVTRTMMLAVVTAVVTVARTADLSGQDLAVSIHLIQGI